MTQISKNEIYQEIGKIISQFNNLECDLCARYIQKWLIFHQIQSKILKLRTKKANDFSCRSGGFIIDELEYL